MVQCMAYAIPNQSDRDYTTCSIIHQSTSDTLPATGNVSSKHKLNMTAAYLATIAIKVVIDKEEQE